MKNEKPNLLKQISYKLVTIPLTQSGRISLKESNSFDDQNQIFIIKYIPVQTPRNKN